MVDPPATLVGIRRYPVKSMGGEGLTEVGLDARGLVGDRGWAVVDGDGRLASGKDSRRFRRRDPVFSFAAHTDPTGSVTVTREHRAWPVDDPELSDLLTAEMGDPVQVLPETDVPHFDAGSVSLVGSASLAWCAERFGGDPDPRRLRANLVVETTEPFVEEGWRRIQVGGAVLAADGRTPRCRMVDIAQDGQAPAERWLTPLTAEREMCLAVYLTVDAPGRIRLGDAVESV